MHDGWWLRDHMFFMEDLLALDSEKVAEGEVLRDAWAQIRDRRQAQAPRGMSTRRRATAKAIAGAAAVVVVSEAFGRVLEEEGLTRGEVIENGIPDFLFDAHRRPASNASQRVGYLAGEARHKGYDLFRHSVALLGAFDGNVTVVSDELPPETKSIEMWGRTLVTRVGRMPRRGIYELMRNLDTVVLPSIIPESYGMLAREALLCGCRIVITDLGGLAELADLPGVFVVEPESAAIAIAIAELGSGGAKREFDPHELARIRGRVRSASSMTRDYVRLFERVVGLRAEN
jgi:glycosyltransferase involved in cell wall biosynthesis